MRRGLGSLAWALLLAAALSCSPALEYDLVFVGGKVVDGTGAPAIRADVALQGDSIAAIEPSLADAAAHRVLDVTGLVVTPGFWDNHAHLVDLEDLPHAENFLRQGITTILATLHSQPQPESLTEYRDRVRMAPNVGLFAGHHWVRERVVGLEDGAPTDTEIAQMESLVERAMEEGALGLSSGLEYVPGAYAETDELVALARVAAGHGGHYSTHLRNEDARVLEAVSEALEIGRRAELPVLINHHKVTGADHFGRSVETLALIDEALREGQEVALDVYPYLAFSTYSDLMFPPWALEGGAERFAERVADRRLRERLSEEMIERFTALAGEGPSSVQFREFRGSALKVADLEDLAGHTLADLLARRKRPETVPAAVAALIELQLEGGFIGIFHGMDQGDLERILRHPKTMICSDGDLVELGVGHPHPRSYGSFPRVLGEWVRDRGALSLEEAIHKMTGQAAAFWRQSDRGTLAVGKLADVVVFDPKAIEDRSSYADPHHFPNGIEWVVVNGEVVVEAGELTSALPGRFLDRIP